LDAVADGWRQPDTAVTLPPPVRIGCKNTII